MANTQPTTESAAVNSTANLEATPEQLADFEARREQALRIAPNLAKRVSPVLPARTGPTAEEQAKREADLAEHDAKMRRTQLAQRLANLAAAAGGRYRDCKLETFTLRRDKYRDQQQKVVQSCREWLEDFGSAPLILFGPCGTGKDHLAFAVSRVLVAQGHAVRWINAQDWFGAVRDAMDTTQSERAMISELSQPDLLVVSDPLPPFGSLSQHQATMLYRVVDARYKHGRPVVCTVNVASDDEAYERLSVPTWSRLCDGAWKCFCDWPSYRKPAREV